MDISVSMNSLFSTTLSNISANNQALTRIQQQITTNANLLTPSDDPFQMAQVLSGQAQDSALTASLSNIRNATSILNQSGSALQQADNILAQAHSIAQEGANGTNNSQSRQALAQQVDGLISQMLQVANTNFNGSYLFGGVGNNRQPYQIVASDAQGLPTAIAYQGQNAVSLQSVNGPQQVATYYPGDAIFGGTNRQATVYSGDPTGAKAGTGTDSAIGKGALIVQHVATTFAGGSGVKAGSGSAAGDTILGPSGAHTLTIHDASGTGASGTVSLDGGPPIPFANTDGNLKVSGPQGQIVYIDTTAVAAGFNGTVAVASSGKLSVDSGASFTPIDFSSNQVVTDSRNGTVVNVDTTKVVATGTNQLTFAGTFDAFGALMALRDDLRNANGLNETQLQQSISSRIAEIDRVKGNVLQTLGQQSADLQNLQSLQSYLQTQQLNVQKQISTIQAPDLATLTVNLQTHQYNLQLTLAAYAQILNTSLLNFLK